MVFLIIWHTAEHEIFGEALSDSDEEHGSKINIMESEEDVTDDSRCSEFYRGNNRVSNFINKWTDGMTRFD